MMLVWALIPLVLIVSMIGVVGVQDSHATVCYDYQIYTRSNALTFYGTVQSSKVIAYDEPFFHMDGTTTHYALHDFQVDEILVGVADKKNISIKEWDVHIDDELEVGSQHLIIALKHDNDEGYYADGCRGIIQSVEKSKTMQLGNKIQSEHLAKLEQMSQSPKTQLENGAKLIICKENYQRIFKNNYENSQVCVKKSSIQKLSERGWGSPAYIDNKPNKIIKINDSDHYIKYRIVKNSEIVKITNTESNSLLFEINTITKGNVIVELPRIVIDAQMASCDKHANDKDDIFFVLIDGQEILYDEVKTTSEIRTLQIPFGEESKGIEIIGTCW